MFWTAEVRDRGDGHEVMLWCSPDAASLRLPAVGQVGAWVRTDLAAEASVREAAAMAGLSLIEVTGRTDPVGGASWWRGVAWKPAG